MEQNIGIIACSVPALQPLFKQWFVSQSSKGAITPGARNNPVLSSWDDSTGLTLLSRPESSRSMTKHGFPKDEELIYPLEERSAKSLRGTNDAGDVHLEAGYDRQRESVHAKAVDLV